MELVGVRNIEITGDMEPYQTTFTIDSGIVYKLISFSHNNLNDGSIRINGNYIFHGYSFASPLPIWLSEGEHSITIGSQFNQVSATLYGLEFKLTTP